MGIVRIPTKKEMRSLVSRKEDGKSCVIEVKRMSSKKTSSEEAIRYYKKKYDAAANEKKSSERCEQSYRTQKKQASTQIDSLTSEKVNLDKRLSGIKRIIKALDGTGGWLSTNVPEAIAKTGSKLSQADAGFRSGIKLTGGTGAVSLMDALAVKTVEGDDRSRMALEKYRREKERLEQRIADLNAKISSLSDQISSLNKKIRECDAMQATLRSRMRSYASEINYYRRHTD